MSMDSEALALANALMKLGSLFDRESLHWRDYPAIATQCRRATGQLVEAARYVLRDQDLAYGEGWAVAAGQVLSHLQLARLFRDGADWVKIYTT
jgi:hypothetical protein